MRTPMMSATTGVRHVRPYHVLAMTTRSGRPTCSTTGVRNARTSMTTSARRCGHACASTLGVMRTLARPSLFRVRCPSTLTTLGHLRFLLRSAARVEEDNAFAFLPHLSRPPPFNLSHDSPLCHAVRSARKLETSTAAFSDRWRTPRPLGSFAPFVLVIHAFRVTFSRRVDDR